MLVYFEKLQGSVDASLATGEVTAWLVRGLAFLGHDRPLQPRVRRHAKEVVRHETLPRGRAVARGTAAHMTLLRFSEAIQKAR